MRFSPKTKEELATMNLIQPGVYDFEIIEAIDKTSQSGNEMIALKLKVWDHQGHERIVFDYLLESMHFKFFHFAEFTGLMDKYNAGCLMAEHCLGKTGKVDIIIQPDKKGLYPDRNSVKDYIDPSHVAERKMSELPKAKEEVFDDEIPF
jgi:hypothetical protein